MKVTMTWGKFFLYLIILLSVLAFVMPPALYELDLLQSFAVHALVGYTALLLLLILLRQWWLSVAAGGAVVVLSLFLMPYLLPTGVVLTETGQPFTVAHFNVLCSNRNYEPTLQQALASRADLLSFQEVDQRWADQLSARLCELYPYHHVLVSSTSTQGIAVFSRYPLQDVQTHVWADTPTLVGNIALGQKSTTDSDAATKDTLVHFVASHALSPRSEQRYLRRNAHLRQVADYLRTVDGPVLAMGDYNAVPWNPHIVAIRRKARLSDSRKTITATYPSRLQEGGIPIDYVFHSDDFACLSFQALQSGGSDHRGVMGTYWLKVI